MPLESRKEATLFPEGFDLEKWRTELGCVGKSEPPLTRLRRSYETITRVLRRMRGYRSMEMAYHSLTSRDRMTFSPRSVFAELDVAAAAKGLKEDGYFTGLFLPDRAREEILNYVDVTRCHAGFGDPHLRQLVYYHHRVKDVEDLVGQPINISHYEAPHVNCPPVARIAHDVKIAEIVRGYLGVVPLKQKTMLWWSHVTTMSDTERLAKSQTIEFHIDELDPDPRRRGNFRCPILYLNFYLTEVGDGAGAHILVKGSHRHKPLSIKFGRGSQSESKIVESYPRDSIIEITGMPGQGFLEDPWIFHKAGIPRRQSRLFLQIRYFV